MRVLHQAAEIPVTPQQEIFDERDRFIARVDLRIDGTRRITNTTAPGIARLGSMSTTSNATAPSSPTVGSGTASPRSTCGGTPPQSSPTPTACWDGPGIRVGWLRGSSYSTTHSSDGPAAPARTATGAEPLPEPVRCNKEKAAIWVVPDRLREEGSGALLATLTLGELFAWHQCRQHRVPDDFVGNDHLCDVIPTGNVVHDIEQDLFEDRSQAAGAGAA